ncbi:MAG: hypothetical protein U9R51_07010 [Actinomycetota bacterium]|nr:hypothetical protein [Actinomycetota bacterium]
MTRTSTLGRWLWILLALVTVSAGLIAIGGSEASAAPDGKTYTATINARETTAGILNSHTLTVTNTSDSTPLGAINFGTDPEIVIDPNPNPECSLVVERQEFDFDAMPTEADPPFLTADGKSWTLQWNEGAHSIELRAVDSSNRLDPGESVEITFDLRVLQDSITAEGCVDYAFPIDARQANFFNGVPGNGLTYTPIPSEDSTTGPELRVWHVAQECTDDPEGCTISRGFGNGTAATFTLTGTCEPEEGSDDCGFIAIENVLEEGAISPTAVIYTPAEYSKNVRAYLTLPKDELTKPASQYTFTLDPLKEGVVPFTVDKCHRDESDCIEKIERTKIDVTWIFRVDPVDPRMSW